MLNTKSMLIEVAQRLFAQKGKRNVTMNDIAEASQKGRRTLYTYFNNKEEIYKAVIDKELDYISGRLKKVSNELVDPDTKLANHVLAHLDSVKEVVNRNGSLRADFFHDIFEVERRRRNIDINEIAQIRDILTLGMEKRIFKNMDAGRLAIIIFYALKGLEVPYIRQNMSPEFEMNKKNIVDFIFTGILRKSSRMVNGSHLF